MIKNIFFDFDGVLAESVDVKTQAFSKLYLPFGEDIAEKVKQHHLENGGMSRYDKFKFYHEQWLNIDMDQELLNSLTQQFSDMVKNGVIESAEVPGTSTFLEENKEHYLMFVITGTPTNEMKEILEKRKMTTYFKDVFGSPTDKTSWSNHILKKWSLKPEETVFIGDASSDLKAANDCGLHFILRKAPHNENIFKHYEGHIIKDLRELNNILKGI